MAHGLPDYCRGIDLAYQSLSKVAIDLAAQSLSNVSVDLAAQSMGQLDIDIIAQTLSNLNIDVTAQSLGQLTNRPKYGGAILSHGSQEVEAHTTTALVSISGKGMIYGGLVWLEYNSSQRLSSVQVEVDDQKISGLSFYGLDRYGVTQPLCYPVFLGTFDDTNYIYSAILSYGITFESKLRLLYKEAHTETPSVTYHLVYALV